MTTAKMKLVVVKVELEDRMENPVANPDPGEHIVVRVVELAELKRVLEGMSLSVRLMLACGTTDVFCAVVPRRLQQGGVRDSLRSERVPDLQRGFHCRCQAVSLCIRV